MLGQITLGSLVAVAVLSSVACSSSSAPSASTAPNPSTFPPYGYIDLTQDQDGLGVSALFGVPSTVAQLPGAAMPSIVSGLDAKCVVQQVEGACAVVACQQSGEGVAHPGVGTLWLLSASSPPLRTDPWWLGNYWGGSSTFAASGTAVTVTASGAELPAFSLAIRVPPSLTLTAPDTSQGLIIDRAHDFGFGWTTGDGLDDVEAYVGTLDNDPTMIVCTYPRAAGSATVSASLLERLKPGDVAASVRPVRTQSVSVGGYVVTVHAEGVGTLGVVTLQ